MATSNDAGVLSAARAARIARIILRRATPAETVNRWMTGKDGNPLDEAGFITAVLESDEFARDKPSDATKLGRAFDAIMDRYDPELARDVDRFVYLQNVIETYDGDVYDLPFFLRLFAKIRAAGYRSDPCGSPTDPSRRMRVALDGQGQALIFTVGTNGHLYLWQRSTQSDASYTQHDLSDALSRPVHGKVLSFDVLQDARGISLAVAVGPRSGSGDSTLYVLNRLSASLTGDQWLTAMGSAKPVAGAPTSLVISDVELSPDDGSAAPLALVGAAVLGITDDYVVDPMAGVWSKLRVPEDATKVYKLAAGTYRRHGLWTLYQVGPDTALTFTTFPDPFGKTINLSYTDLPPDARTFGVLPGSVNPAAPDVFVGGNGLVVYRSSIDSPQPVVPSAKAVSFLRVVRVGTVDHVWYVDLDDVLRYVHAENGKPWSAPVDMAADVAAVQFFESGLGLPALAVITSENTLELRRWVADSWQTTELPMRAVWEEVPLTLAELTSFITTKSPIVYFSDEESFFPSAVDFFLPHVGLWSKAANDWHYPPGSLWDATLGDMPPAILETSLPRTKPQDSDHPDFIMKIPDEAYNQSKDGYPHPYGPLLAGDQDHAPFYVHAKFHPAKNVTEIVYWMFAPYNGAGTLKVAVGPSTRYIDCWPLGIHEGDWEHFTLQVDNDSKELVSIYLSQHSDGASIPAAQLNRDQQTGRSLLYSSKHGHAFYASPGTNMLMETKGEKVGISYDFGLVNSCSAGYAFDFTQAGRTKLVSASFLGDEAPTEPNWLKCVWRWGRDHDWTGGEIKNVVNAILGPCADLLGPVGISDLVADLLVKYNAFGGEGNSEGPAPPMQKTNWLAGEND